MSVRFFFCVKRERRCLTYVFNSAIIISVREILASDLFQGEHVKFFNKVLFLFAFMTPVMVQAQPLTPTGTFGSQPTMTFGGTGIPNDAVMTNSNAGTLGVLVGLTAHQRCGAVVCNPALTNDGYGTFYASPGTDLNPPSPANPYATWNFGFYIGGANATQYNYKLFYDFNPAAGNSDYGNLGIAPVPTQDSWNLGMDFLSPPSVLPGYVFPPTYAGGFDPNAVGVYNLGLIVYQNQLDGSLLEVGRSSIQVNVGTPVPEPSSFALLAVGTLGIAGYARRKKLS